MNAKSIIAVIIVAVLVGVLYVLFEKTFTGTTNLSNSSSSSAQELIKEKGTTQQLPQQTSLINLPTPAPTPAPITESSNLLQEADGLQMRDYSTYFEDLKETVNK